MAATDNMIRIEENNSLSFGNHTLSAKAKVENFAYQGDLLKVKTFYEITKLEKNGSFLYESVPGTSVTEFMENEDGMEFMVFGKEDAQITVGLAAQTAYEVIVGEEKVGVMETNLSGKLSVGVEFLTEEPVKVKVKKA